MDKFLYTVTFFAVVCFTLVICAQVYHDRYNTTLAFLPCRNDHEHAYYAAAMWLQRCHDEGIPTWVCGDTRLCTFRQPPVLFEWMTSLEFRATAIPKSGIYKGVTVTVCDTVPPTLEICTLGSVQYMKRTPLTNNLVRVMKKVSIPRRNIFDLCRLPLATSDAYYGWGLQEQNTRRTK